MNAPKLIEVIEIYRAKLAHIVPCKEAYPHDVLLRDEWSALKHARHCLDEIEAFVREGRLEKAFRWLGFVQGVLWACRVYDINELKSHNRPDDQEKEFFNPDRDLRHRVIPQPTKEQAEGWAKSALEPIVYAPCALPPEGWECSRPAGHEGPCAASPTSAHINHVDARHAIDPGGNPIPRPVNYVHRETPMAGNQPAKTARGERFPKGTPVKILAGGAVGSFGKLGVVEDHIEEGYAVRLEGTTEVIYAESVEYARPAR